MNKFLNQVLLLLIIMVQVKLNFRGRVQGVCFRANCKAKADEFKLVGYVKNLDDGTVELVAQGPKDKLDEFIEYCTSDVDIAYVEDLDLEYSDNEDEFEKFEILR